MEYLLGGFRRRWQNQLIFYKRGALLAENAIHMRETSNKEYQYFFIYKNGIKPMLVCTLPIIKISYTGAL